MGRSSGTGTVVGVLIAALTSAFSGCTEDTDGANSGSQSGGAAVTGGAPASAGAPVEGGGGTTGGQAGDSGGANDAGGAFATAGAGGSAGEGGEVSTGGATPSPDCIDPLEAAGEDPADAGGAADERGIFIRLQRQGGVSTVGTAALFTGWGSWDTRCYEFETQWSFVEVPDGSALTDADLETNGLSTSFFVDRSGTYRLRFTLTTADGRSSSSEIETTVPRSRIPYVLVASNGSAFSGAVRAVSDDGVIDEALGPTFEQEPTSEEAWLEHEFERDVAARTSVAFALPSGAWTLAHPSDLRKNRRTLALFPANPNEMRDSLGDGEAPSANTSSRIAYFQRRGDVFQVANVDQDLYYSTTGRREMALPTHPMRPFWLEHGTDVGVVSGFAWIEASAQGGDFDIWFFTPGSVGTNSTLSVILSCGAGERDFTSFRQIASTRTAGLVALATRDAANETWAVYRMTRDSDGNFSCDADSPSNHLVYSAPSAGEPILEIVPDELNGDVLIVQELDDARSTEIWRAGYEGDAPRKILDIGGRNTGLHVFGEDQLIWTRIQYEPGTGTRPTSSEVWRCSGSACARKTLLVAHESSAERAVLLTTGLNAGGEIPLGIEVLP